MILQEDYTTLFQDFPQTPGNPSKNPSANLESPNLAVDPAFDGETYELMNNDFPDDEDTQEVLETDTIKLPETKGKKKPKQSPSPQRIPSTILPIREVTVGFVSPAPITKKAPAAQVPSASGISENGAIADYRRLSEKVLQALKKASDQEKSVLSDTLCDLMLNGGNEFDKTFLISER